MAAAQKLPPLTYVCIMPGDEDVMEDKPGSCPKCKMDLVPVRLDAKWWCPVHQANEVYDAPRSTIKRALPALDRYSVLNSTAAAPIKNTICVQVPNVSMNMRERVRIMSFPSGCRFCGWSTVAPMK